MAQPTHVTFEQALAIWPLRPVLRAPDAASRHELAHATPAALVLEYDLDPGTRVTLRAGIATAMPGPWPGARRIRVRGRDAVTEVGPRPSRDGSKLGRPNDVTVERSLWWLDEVHGQVVHTRLSGPPDEVSEDAAVAFVEALVPVGEATADWQPHPIDFDAVPELHDQASALLSNFTKWVMAQDVAEQG